jgi:hypothetical protein
MPTAAVPLGMTLMKRRRHWVVLLLAATAVAAVSRTRKKTGCPLGTAAPVRGFRQPRTRQVAAAALTRTAMQATDNAPGKPSSNGHNMHVQDTIMLRGLVAHCRKSSGCGC